VPHGKKFWCCALWCPEKGKDKKKRTDQKLRIVLWKNRQDYKKQLEGLHPGREKVIKRKWELPELAKG